MSVNLKDYGELIDELPENHRQLLEAEWHEAARILSPRGLDNWLKSAAALHRMGRGGDIVAAWIEEVPGVAREVGEDVIPDFAQACLQFASRTSGAVIELVIATAPIAAKRLGDAELFRGYLQLLNVLLGQAARGLRPMLEHLDQLLGVLTLGGLRRWALWGAQAHRSNFDEQVRYFSLESEEAKAMLQKERKGTLFVDIHRRIGMYLRALWGRDFFMRPTAGDFESREGFKPFIADYFLHLPDAYDDWNGIPGLDLYRAAAAHCAAHVVATTARIDADRLTVLQQACVGLFEDARVETLAIRRFPRLKDFWAQFHIVQAKGESVGAYLNRIARALLDPAYEDADPLVVWAREGFANADLASNGVSIELGLELAEELMKRRLPFSPYHDVQEAPYRDDNRYLWEYEEYSYEQAIAAGFLPQQQVRKYVSVMEMANEIDVETAGDDAEEIWVLGTELFPYENIGDVSGGKSFNELEGKEPVSDPFHYSEWDYQIQLERPAWATVLEKRPKFGDLQVIEDITAQYKREIQRMKFLLDAMQPQGVQRIRRLEDGDEIDINAAIASFTDIRLGNQPDPRIMMRSVRKTREFSILVLLDLSESTNERVQDQEYSVRELTQQACVLLANAINRVGDPFAIHGFCSDGRHDVEYYRFKDFNQPWDETPKARLAGMTGQLSTRMGAAIRHAGHHLNLQRSAKKLLIIITDGEPADVDVRDPQYLRYDTKKAVEEVAKLGVTTYCMSLDPRADNYVSRIFGQKNYMVVDHVQRLPEKLPLLYAGLTR